MMGHMRAWLRRHIPRTIAGVFALVIGIIFVWELAAPRSLNRAFDWLVSLLGGILVVALVGSVLYLLVHHFLRWVDDPKDLEGPPPEPLTASLWPPDTPLEERVPPIPGQSWEDWGAARRKDADALHERETRSLAASVLSQDETKGQPRKKK